jgi:hypothetical protein
LSGEQRNLVVAQFKNLEASKKEKPILQPQYKEEGQKSMGKPPVQIYIQKLKNLESCVIGSSKK